MHQQPQSERQFRLLLGACGGRCRRVGMHEAPAHARHFSGAPGEHELRGSPGPSIIGAPRNRWSEPGPRNWQDDTSLKVTVECAAVARATGRQLSRLVGGRPQFTTMRCWFDDSSKARKPPCAFWLTPTGG